MNPSLRERDRIQERMRENKRELLSNDFSVNIPIDFHEEITFIGQHLMQKVFY